MKRETGQIWGEEEAKQKLCEFFDLMKERVMRHKVVGATWHIKPKLDGYMVEGKWVVSGFNLNFHLTHEPMIVNDS